MKAAETAEDDDEDDDSVAGQGDKDLFNIADLDRMVDTDDGGTRATKEEEEQARAERDRQIQRDLQDYSSEDALNKIITQNDPFANKSPSGISKSKKLPSGNLYASSLFPSSSDLNQANR